MNRRLLQLLALMAALLLTLSACGGGTSDEESDDNGDDTTSEAETDEESDETSEESDSEGEEAAHSGGTFAMYGCEPQTLIPGDTNETCGSEVLNALFSGLVEYDPVTNEAIWGDAAGRAHAASIESEDNIVWTVTLKEGWTFHDGTPVTAQSYVDGWNFVALSTNGQAGNYFFSEDVLNVQGYDELQAETDDEGEVTTEPTATELSGLSVIDDNTFEITLNGPNSAVPTMIGYTIFYPAHPLLFEDQAAYNEAPIGNGPFMIDGEWEHDVAIHTVRYEDYGGEPAMADGVDFKIYSEISTAYNDLLAGNLDVLDSVPPEQLSTAADEFGDRFIEGNSSNFTYVGFPTWDEAFQDPKMRQAFSMAIDRQGIIDAVFNGVNTPADAFVSPVVDGYREGACSYCVYDPEAAKALYDEAGGYDGTLTLWFNSGAGHEEWMEAVANQLMQNLGVEDVKFESLQFADYLDKLDGHEVDGPFRLGWVMDFPLSVNYLGPIHATTGSSNHTGYSNPEVDALIAQGLEAPSVAEGVALWQEAEDILLEDMPIIPMFFGKIQGAHSEHVSNVNINSFTTVDVASIVVNE